MNNPRLLEICGHFSLSGEAISVDTLGEGFINDTYIVGTKDGSKYILQRKNANIFKDIPGMMSNIVKVTEHLKSKIIAAGGDPNRESLSIISTLDNKLFYADKSQGQTEYWTMTLHISDTVSYVSASSPFLAEQGGRGIGKFQAMMSDFTGELVNTLPGFHDIRYRFQQWDDCLERDPVNRAASVAKEIECIDSRRDEMLQFHSLVESGEIPLRVTHNDTKISNILFDGSGKVLCVIDLDTVLRAPCLYDFGDAIRSYTNTGMEDDKDLSKVSMSKEMYDAFLKGYLSEADRFLTPVEKHYLPFSAIYITYEQVLRFLMDYMDGDHYYRIKYPEHNLIRARAQYALLTSIQNQLQ